MSGEPSAGDWHESEEVSNLDMILHGLKALAGDSHTLMAADELGALAVTLTDARRRLDGILATIITEASRSGVPARSGLRTMAQYIASQTHDAPAVTRADERIGRWATQLPLVEDAMLTGRLSRQHCEKLKELDNPRTAAALRRDQHLFVEWARDLEWKSFKKACASWLLANDPDGTEPEHQELDNSLTIQRTADGRVKGRFDLDAASGEVLLQNIGNEETALLHTEREAGALRTVAHRRATALVNIVRRGAGRSTETAKPLIHIVMSLQVLQNAIAQMANDPSERDFTSMLDPNDVDGRCELIDGTPIHPKYALILMMQARIRRQVLTAKDVTLNASHETRLFPDWMHYIRLIETRGNCVVAGCDAPHTWLHRDHREPASKHGPTSVANLDPVCGPDNRHKADGPPLQRRDPIPERDTYFLLQDLIDQLDDNEDERDDD